MKAKKGKVSKDLAQRINKEKLLELLSKMSFALDKKNIGHSGEIIFLKNRVCIYNGEICISAPFKSNIEFSVNGDIFIRVLKSFLEKQLRMRIEGGSLKIYSDVASAKIPFILISDINVEIMNEIDSILFNDSKWAVFSENILEGLYMCGFSTSQDLTRGALYCVAVYNDRILSTDDLRLSRFIFNDGGLKMKQKRWLIPYVYLDYLYKDKYSEYCEYDSWLCFREEKEGMFFGLRKIIGDHVENSDRFFDIERKNMRKIIFPNEVLSFLDLVVGLMDEIVDYDKIIRLKAKSGELRFLLEKDFLSKERLFILEDKVDFDFFINPVFFKQILARGNKFYIDKNNQRLYFYSKKFSHILSLYQEKSNEQ